MKRRRKSPKRSVRRPKTSVDFIKVGEAVKVALDDLVGVGGSVKTGKARRLKRVK